MATYPTQSKSTHKLRNTFLKAAFWSVVGFGAYQFWTPNTWKDDLGKKVEQVTHSHTLGHAVSTLHPWEKPVVQVNLRKPGN